MFVSETFSLEDCYAYVSDFSDWDTVTNKGTSYTFSPFTCPTNHSIELKCTSTPNTRIAIGDKTTVNSSGYLEWIYAVYFNSKYCYTRSSSNAEVSNRFSSVSYTSNDILKVTYSGTVLKLYVNDELENTWTSYDPLSLTRLLRITSSDISNISYMKIKPL